MSPRHNNNQRHDFAWFLAENACQDPKQAHMGCLKLSDSVWSWWSGMFSKPHARSASFQSTIEPIALYELSALPMMTFVFVLHVSNERSKLPTSFNPSVFVWGAMGCLYWSRLLAWQIVNWDPQPETSVGWKQSVSVWCFFFFFSNLVWNCLKALETLIWNIWWFGVKSSKSSNANQVRAPRETIGNTQIGWDLGWFGVDFRDGEGAGLKKSAQNPCHFLDKSAPFWVAMPTQIRATKSKLRGELPPWFLVCFARSGAVFWSKIRLGN